MAENFIQLSRADRRDLLGIAAARSGRPPHLLEKDVWVVWALDALFGSVLGDHLVFKGGTSLSKAYGVIHRFSEDVDLTYDIRALIPDLAGSSGEALPANRSQKDRWKKEVDLQLPKWVAEQAHPMLVEKLATDGIAATVTAAGEELLIDYEPLAMGSGYVAARVKLEFGASSTGEPNAVHGVVCDAASVIDDVVFPTARPRVMRAERTFWEKATAAHVFCAQARLRGERFARHWHDLARLDEAGYATTAIADRELAAAVARHKAIFFREMADGAPVDYATAVSGGLHLVPVGAALDALAEDYSRMVDDGLLLNDAEPFVDLMQTCETIAERANAIAAVG